MEEGLSHQGAKETKNKFCYTAGGLSGESNRKSVQHFVNFVPLWDIYKKKPSSFALTPFALCFS